MADNDRFVIVKLSDFDRVVGGYLVSIKESDKQIKPRAEYEAIILETINYECSSVLNEIKSVNTKEIAKAVVGRLFGEEEK